MKFILPFIVFLFILPNFPAFAQNNAAKGLLESITRKKFKELPATPKYPYASFGKEVAVIPSITLQGDTSGLVFHMEYVLFRNGIYGETQAEKAKFICSDYVTNAEFQEMMNYVRDSMAREKMYYGMEDDKLVSRLIIHPTKNFDPSDRTVNRMTKKYPLNWKRLFSYTDPKLIPYFTDMYLPIPERIYNVREFDQRKLFYRYELNGIQSHGGLCASMLADNYLWALRSDFPGDEAFVLANTYHRFAEFSKKPVVGLNGQQAEAFCYWKQKTLQEEADKKNLPVRIVVTLPLVEDLEQIKHSDTLLTIPEFDHTKNWRITWSQYKEFTDYVQDSVLKELYYNAILSDTLASELLAHRKSYFNEGTNETLLFDARSREENRRIFPFTSKSLPKKQKELTGQLNDYGGPGELRFAYYGKDAKRMAYTGNLALAPENRNMNYHPSVLQQRELYVYGLDEYEDPNGKDLNLDYYWGVNRSISGVRAHENYQRFIRRTEIAVMPKNGANVPADKSAPAEISYEQALAYYHWKFPMYTAGPKEHWQNFVFPSKEQFEKVQRGEKLIVPARKLAYPGNLFRYVVHIYDQT